MRKVIFSILLASAAASPALAQDEGRWHREHSDSEKAQANEQRQQQHEERVQQAQPQQQAQPRLEGRQQWQGGNFEGRRFEQRNNVQGDVQAHAQVQAQQQAVQQERQREFERRRQQWQGRNDAAGQAVVQQQEQQRQWQRRGFDSGQRNDTAQQQWQGRSRYTGTYNGQTGQWSQQRYTQQGGSRYSGNWNRNWRNDSRYDWRRYRNSHRSLFSLGIYYDPFGYGYQPFDIGYRLPYAYFGQRYWIDPAMYQLPYPPPGTMWVRYWNDALLVDMYTGQVVDVIRGFFW